MGGREEGRMETIELGWWYTPIIPGIERLAARLFYMRLRLTNQTSGWGVGSVVTSTGSFPENHVLSSIPSISVGLKTINNSRLGIQRPLLVPVDTVHGVLTYIPANTHTQ